MSRSTTHFSGLLPIAGLLLVCWPVGVFAADTTAASASQRVSEAIRAAWAGPDLERAIAGLEVARAEAIVRRNPGSPYIELASEGIASSDRPNAISYLRLGTPFNGLRQSSRSRALLETTDAYTIAAGTTAAIEVAELTAGTWIELAARTDELEVRRRQLERLDAALALQRQRLDVGEISGSELTQLALERARLISLVAEQRVRQARLMNDLRQLSGPDVSLPVADDLARLDAELDEKTFDPTNIEKWINSSAQLRSARLEADRIRVEGELAGATARGRPEFELSWEHTHSFEVLPSYDTLGARVRMPLPLGNASKVQRARFNQLARQADVDVERLRRNLNARLLAAVETVEATEESLEAIESMEDELPMIERSLSEQFRFGAISYLVYIDGLSRLDEVRVQAIAARHAELGARLSLATISGDHSLFPLPDLPEEEQP